MSHNRDEVKEWLQLVEYDMISAKILLSHEPPILETACFHCQQAIEKTLKAFLVWNGKSFAKIHDLDLNFLKDKADLITSYAVDMRYLSKHFEVSKEEADEAFSLTNDVLRLVKNIIHIQ